MTSASRFGGFGSESTGRIPRLIGIAAIAIVLLILIPNMMTYVNPVLAYGLERFLAGRCHTGNISRWLWDGTLSWSTDSARG